MSIVGEHLSEIRDRIEQACQQAGRDPAEVRLMAVSKRQPDARLQEAVECGLRLFGESRVQETRDRIDRFPDDARIHMIGHLQRNKAREAARLYQAVDSIDAERTARALDEACAREGFTMPVLLEVNTSGEASKYGVEDLDTLRRLADTVRTCGHLQLDGVMTIGPISTDEAKLRAAFASLRDMLNRLRIDHPDITLPELSMGMSNDYHYAILEGATTVRVGTALFGARDS